MDREDWARELVWKEIEKACLCQMVMGVMRGVGNLVDLHPGQQILGASSSLVAPPLDLSPVMRLL